MGTRGEERGRQRHTGRHVGRSAVSFLPAAENLSVTFERVGSLRHLVRVVDSDQPQRSDHGWFKWIKLKRRSLPGTSWLLLHRQQRLLKERVAVAIL